MDSPVTFNTVNTDLHGNFRHIMTRILGFESSSSAGRGVFMLLVLLLPAAYARAQMRPAPGVIDVVALRVEFQPDTTRFTTGDGTFAGVLFEGVDPPKIDPLPHDAGYFSAHLRFLENYIGRVSDGKTRIRTHLLPDVIRVSEEMGQYSPTGEDSNSDGELLKLVSFVQESWFLADVEGVQLPDGLDPERTTFILFHAGIGRDIELVGTTLDKTPQDLPSLFLGEAALDRLGGGSMTVDGIEIRNTLIIPRTESRLGFNFLTEQPFLIELSTNGLLAASFLNYLGVPDLFNTVTGESAIGPFGVMDALGIFAFSGLFPPEPSAWTKRFLGWADVVEDPAPESIVRLRASGDPDLNETALLSISDAEYFLIENRHRDPEGDGVHLRVWDAQGERDVVFDNADPEFNTQTVAAFPGGVVVDVDNYDFALPGGIDENDNPLLGGMLIWHIDENRLRAGFDNNSVNADPLARSIDLEEADGAQDIGFSSNASIFGPRFDLGTPFDFWYEGNPVTVRTNTGQEIRLYENRFASDTVPSSDANGGVPSVVNLTNFSGPGVEMSFTVGARDGQAVPIVEQRNALLGESAFQSGGLLASGNPENLIWSFGSTEGGDGFLWSSTNPSDGESSGPWAYTRPAIGPFGAVVVSSEYFSLDSMIPGLSGSIPISPPFSQALTNFSPKIASFQTGGRTTFRVGAMAGTQPVIAEVSVEANGISNGSVNAATGRVLDILFFDRNSSRQLIVTDIGVFDGQGSVLVSTFIDDIAPYSRIDGSVRDDGWMLGWASTSRDVIHTLTSEGVASSIVPSNIVPSHSCLVTDPVFFDIDADGDADVVFGCGAWLYAVHSTGALVSSFPFALSGDAVSDPIAAVDLSGSSMIFVSTANGYLDGIGITSAANRLEGFPLPIGKVSAVAPHVSTESIVTISGSGEIRSWEYQSESARNAVDFDILAHPRFEGGATPDDASRLLIGNETYNWPNPIEDGVTHIRFSVLEASDVRVTIVDMFGAMIDEFEMVRVRANVPSEVEWRTSAGSGIYLVRVRATSVSGRKDSRLIKMAIIR